MQIGFTFLEKKDLKSFSSHLLYKSLLTQFNTFCM